LERKLTAILCADVHGYSRLMGEDEEATHRILKSCRKLIDSLIEEHHGRFVNSAGDSVLAEFASVVNAVECAVEIQTTLKSENGKLPPDRRMEFRIGINLGDVIVDGEQIYGDGVNVAARLESLAEPGGICVSGSVHEQLGNKLAISYEDLGQQTVKNIANPVRVLRVMLDGGAATRTTTKAAEQSPRKHWRGSVFSIAGLAIIAATVVFVQHLSLRPPTTTASIPPQQRPALPLPNIPSIALLPFTNMSGDREQEYFSDGITDDLITSLSRLPGLLVIARNSTFTYKGKAVKEQQVSRELGVKYVLEGGVRKAGDQVRITAQLVDATTGTELWSERYDRPMKDIFSLQDEIVRRIVTTVNLQLSLWDQRGVLVRKHTDNLEAYDDFLRGFAHQNGTEEGNAQARQMFEKAIELDPRYADAYVAKGFSYWFDWTNLWTQDPQTLERAFELAQKALALDDSEAAAHTLMGNVYLYKKHYDQAIAECERAIDLNPNLLPGYFWLAHTLFLSGKPTEAIGMAEQAMRLDPRNRDFYLVEVGFAYSFTGRNAEAIPMLKTHLIRNPKNFYARLALVAAYSETGRDQEARAEAAEVLRANPRFSLERLSQRLPLADRALSERYFADYRKAGLK